MHRWPARRDAEGYIRGYLEYLSYDLPLALRLLLQRRPQVVVCEPPPTTGAVVRVICSIRRVPYVYYAGDIWSEALKLVRAPHGVMGIVSRLERWALQGAAGVLAVSPGVVQAVERLGVTSPVHLVGNGIDTDVFTPDGPAARHGTYFVYTGTASEVHGATIFLDAFERVLQEHPDCRLVYIGQGTDMAEIIERTRSLPPGSVQVLPRLTPAQTASWIRGARAALASVRPGSYGFAFPSKAYAAAACGVPVIMAAHPDTRQPIVDGDLGWAVDFDLGAVTDAMMQALTSTDDDQTRARRRTWVQHTASLEEAAERSSRVILDAVARP